MFEMLCYHVCRSIMEDGTGELREDNRCTQVDEVVVVVAAKAASMICRSDIGTKSFSGYSQL